MKYISAIFLFLVLAGFAGGLTGCGKMSEPRPLEGSGYPHAYPR